MTDTKRPLRVFLCHSSGDKQKVRELYHQLKNDGLEPWLDEEDLLPGFEWQVEIPTVVQNSDIVIVCLSKDSVSKAGYIQKEIKLALDVADEQPEGTIFVIPLKLEECDVPKRLSRWQWVSLYSDNGYQRLLRSLRIRADEKKNAKLAKDTPSSIQSKQQVFNDYTNTVTAQKSGHKKGRFSIRRRSQNPGGGMRYGVFLDGQKIGTLASEEKLEVNAENGQHFIHLEWTVFKSNKFVFVLREDETINLVCGERLENEAGYKGLLRGDNFFIELEQI